MQREHRAREQGTHQLSATTAQDVTIELFVLLRCVRETRRHGEEAVAFAASERVLVDELPQFVSVIGNRRADKHRRMAALGQVAKSLAYVASSKEIMLLSKFDETGLLRVIVTWCLEVPPDDLFVLGNGLTILSNVAFMAHANMVVEAGAVELLVRLLCDDGHAGTGSQQAPSASPEVTAYAAAALSNLVADAYGASSFSAEQRARLLLMIGAMSDVPDLTLRGYVLSASKNLKRVVDALSPAQLEALRKKTDRKHKKVKVNFGGKGGKRGKTMSPAEFRRQRAVERLQRRWRGRRDGRLSAPVLKSLHAAATLIQKHARAREVRRDFGAIVHGRAVARAQHEALVREDFAARVICRQQRNRFMRSTLRDALGSLVDDRRAHETERRTREVVDRVAQHMERGAALRMYHGDELRTHLKRRAEARRERRETEQALEVASRLVDNAAAVRRQRVGMRDGLEAKVAARRAREAELLSSTIATMAACTEEGAAARAQLGRQLQGELAQRALVRHRAVESATAIVHTYQRGRVKREALRDALEQKVLERRRQRALEQAAGVVNTVTRRYQEGRAARRQLLESFNALVEARRECDARRRAHEVSTALAEQMQARRANEVLLGDELSARVTARREREARQLAEAAATLIARHARGKAARAGFGERMSGLLARRQERHARMVAQRQREVSAVVIARYQRGREVRARMGELLQQRVNAKQIHRAAGLKEKSKRRERLEALTKGRHHPKPKLANGTSVARGQFTHPHTILPPLVTGGLSVVNETGAEGGCPAEWHGLCAQREAVIGRLLRGAHRLAHCVATDDPSAARRAFCKDLAALRSASLALAEVLEVWLPPLHAGSRSALRSPLLPHHVPWVPVPAFPGNRTSAALPGSLSQAASGGGGRSVAQGTGTKAATLELFSANALRRALGLDSDANTSASSNAPANTSASGAEGVQAPREREAAEKDSGGLEHAPKPLDYLLTVLTDVRRLPLPSYSDPFTLRWFPAQSPFAPALLSSKTELARFAAAERFLKLLLPRDASISQSLNAELSTFEELTGLTTSKQLAVAAHQPPGAVAREEEERLDGWSLLAHTLYEFDGPTGFVHLKQRQREGARLAKKIGKNPKLKGLHATYK